MQFTSEEVASSKFVCNRKILADIIFESKWKNFDKKMEDVELFLIKNSECCEESNTEVKTFMKTFKFQFKNKWEKSNRTKSNFLLNEKKWLEAEIEFVKYSSNIKKVGRPSEDFASSSTQTKRKRTADLRASSSTAELLFATQMKLRAEGHKDAAQLIKKVSDEPDSAKELSSEHKSSTLTPLQALSMLIEANLSRHQYEVVRSYAKDIFPSYKKIQAEKQNSYPEGINVNEAKAKVPLQSLVNNTAVKIVESQKPLFEVHKAKTLTLTYKWGFDGSSGHSQYHQAFLSEQDADDKFVFLTCLVPLQLSSDDNDRVYWKNECPSSPRFCRPISITFEKESDALVLREKASIDQEIENITSTNVMIGNEQLQINHVFIFCMLDGKLCNSLSDTTSALRCYLCKASSKDFNNIEKVQLLPLTENYLSFGMSVLHAWIRSFECLLHVSYKLEVKEWRSNKEIEPIIKSNQTRIQKLFKERMGLIVDKPKPGYGNTNTGNVARRFFQNAELSSEITGIDLNLLHRFHIILQCISSGFRINKEKFKSYCLETAKLFVSLYPWFYMTTTVHKLLIHGHEIISSSLLPIGQLSEEALEARNKDFKNYRQFHSRKTSRKDTMEDIFNRMLISSDPLLSSLRQHVKGRKAPFHKDALDMFEETTFMEDSMQSF